MFKEERHYKIIEYMTEQARDIKGVKTKELRDFFQVSISTIRRDLRELEKLGVIKRIHGGAILKEPLNSQYDFLMKKDDNLDLKREIAKYAASLIEDGDRIAINTSTLTYLIVEYIRARDVTIVTNSLAAAHIFPDSPSLDLILLGGIYIAKAKTVEGSLTVEQIRNMNFNKAFLGANGVSLEDGITTAGPIEVASKKAMISSSSQSYFLCESSKFNRSSFYRLDSPEDKIKIITDQGLSDLDYKKYGEKYDLIRIDS